MENYFLHRKSKHEVLIITQDDDNIDSSVNGIREELIFLMRQERLGLKNRVQLRYFLGHQSIKNTPYATSSVNYDKAIFDLYQSYAPNLAGNIKEIRKTKFFLFLYGKGKNEGESQSKGKGKHRLAIT